jgi:hypothetical protein
MKYASLFALAFFAATAALAQPYNTSWVSHSGADIAACGPTSSPCRTLEAAYFNTNSGGIIKAMDAGEYGSIYGNHPIVIDGNGVGAVIEVGATAYDGVDMQNAGRVEIRNLAIHVPFSCGGCSGIVALNSFVTIENVSITGALNFGVQIKGGLATIRGLTVTGATYGIQIRDDQRLRHPLFNLRDLCERSQRRDPSPDRTLQNDFQLYWAVGRQHPRRIHRPDLGLRDYRQHHRDRHLRRRTNHHSAQQHLDRQRHRRLDALQHLAEVNRGARPSLAKSQGDSMKCVSIFALALLAATAAQAQPYNTSWVSHSGVDNGTCGPTSSPCRTFQGAYNNTNGGGIIKAMDAGQYDRVGIFKPMVIDGNGVGAVIEVDIDGNGLDVNNAGRVEIRNLAIHVPFGCSTCSGIVTGNSFVSIENVSITGALVYGLWLQGGLATVHGVTVTGATNGIGVFDITATISDSAVRYSTKAIYVAGTNAVTQALVERTKMISNTTGLWVQSNGFATTARISDSVITGNTTGTTIVTGGQIITLRNNTWAGNTTDGSTPFSISLK